MSRWYTKAKRHLCFESLETRALMTVEGQSYGLDLNVDVSDLYGEISGKIAWGDSTESTATVQNAPVSGPIKFRFDYSLDSSGFFSDVARRTLLQTAADMLSSKFSDSLSPIQPQSGDTWEARFLHPITGLKVSKPNLTIAANEILVFVGARDLGASEGGLADRGGFTAQSTRPAFLDAVSSRGQAGASATPATDVGPWGGSIAFDSGRNWYFGMNPSGLQSTQLDFVSVATHELMHVMGFGTTGVWDSKVVNNTFTGTHAVAVHGASVPLSDSDHFSNSILVDGRRPTMIQVFSTGERLLPSRLDLAGLRDIGWQLIPQTVRVTGSHVFGDNLSANIRVTLSGASLGTKSTTTLVPVTNAAPVLSAITDKAGQVGVPLTLQALGQFTDAGFGLPFSIPPSTETFTYRVQWGDGTPDSTGVASILSLGSPGQPTVGFFDAQHTYSDIGTYLVKVRITDDDGGFSERQFQVVVTWAGRISLSLDRATIAENAGPGAALMTVTRTASNLSAPLVVQLTSSDITEANVPSSVTIPADLTSTTVSVSAIDDALFDGTQTVIFTPFVPSFESIGVSLVVTDHQPLALTATGSELEEGVPGRSSMQVTVGIRSPAPTGGLEVLLSSSPSGVLMLPSTLTIAGGSTQASFTVSVFNDSRPSNPRSVLVQAVGLGLIDGSLRILVLDDDPARWTNPTLAYDVDNSGSLNPLDALVLIDEINRRGSRILDPVLDSGLPLVDPNRDGALDPLDVLFVIDQINRG